MKFALIILATGIYAQSIPAGNYDAGKTSWNSAETKLTLQNVNSLNFGHLCDMPVDGEVYAQILYREGILIHGVTRNIVVIATMANSVYAYDANSCGGSYLWRTHFDSPRTSYPSQTMQDFHGAPVGCVATPVIDLATNTLYVSCTNTAPTWILRAISLYDGSVLGSIIMTGSVMGTGDPTGGDMVSGGVLTFYPDFELSRTALAFANGNVYVPFGSYGDNHPWHGWIFSYSFDGSAFTKASQICLSPNGYGASIWNAGGGLAIDGSGNLYTPTGNGDYDGSLMWGSSYIKLNPSLAVTDWFTPTDWMTLNDIDADPSSNRFILIPGTKYLVVSSKDFNVFVLDSTNMGHLTDTTVQTFPVNPSHPPASGSTGAFGGAYVNGNVFFAQNSGFMYGFNWTGSAFNTSSFQSPTTYPGPGSIPSGSSAATVDAIIWAMTPNANAFSTTKRDGTLRAFRASDLTQIYSALTGTQNFVKFVAPTVVNGKVYIPTLAGVVYVYGLLPTPPPSSFFSGGSGVF